MPWAQIVMPDGMLQFAPIPALYPQLQVIGKGGANVNIDPFAKVVQDQMYTKLVELPRAKADPGAGQRHVFSNGLV